MDDPDFGFDDLNPPLPPEGAGDAFSGCLLWLMVLGFTALAVKVAFA